MGKSPREPEIPKRRRSKYLRRRRVLRTHSTKRKRRQRAQEKFRELTLEAADYRCERCEIQCGRSQDDWQLPPIEAHHYLPRSRGGGDSPARNGIALCATRGTRKGCHQHVHDHTIDDWPHWIDSSSEPALARLAQDNASPVIQDGAIWNEDEVG